MHAVVAIQRILARIERELDQPLSLDALARAAGMSRWHFLRTFSAMVGEPPARYIRRRRISEAARLLHQTPRSILEVALGFQFESHEAFTRAFKAEVGITPREWRTRNRCASDAAVPFPPVSLDASTLNARFARTSMNPEFLQLPAAVFAGLEARFIPVLSPDSDNLQVIPALWQRFLGRLGDLCPREPGITHGLCKLPESGKPVGARADELLYLAGVEIERTAPLPPGMVTWHTPGGLHAKFVHRGPIAGIGETMGAIYGGWFPSSGYTRGEGPDIERYDARFHPTRDDSLLEIYIPVRPVAPGAKRPRS
jgi:AraC family transcriptional regulator